MFRLLARTFGLWMMGRGEPRRPRPPLVARVSRTDLLVEAVADVREDVVDLASNHGQDDDDNNCDKDEDKGVLDPTLPLLTVANALLRTLRKLAKSKVQVAQHNQFTSFVSGVDDLLC